MLDIRYLRKRLVCHRLTPRPFDIRTLEGFEGSEQIKLSNKFAAPMVLRAIDRRLTPSDEADLAILKNVLGSRGGALSR